MGKIIDYTIFKTAWGYFGLGGTEKGVLRTFLPAKTPGTVQQAMLDYDPYASRRQDFGKPLQEKVSAYFEGDYVDFTDVAVDLEAMTSFSEQILLACRRIPYGVTSTYGKLADTAGKPRAARAVGSVMARNLLPLIIPCHRVIRADGAPGEFSAVGGTKMKKRLIALEARSRTANLSPCLSST